MPEPIINMDALDLLSEEEFMRLANVSTLDRSARLWLKAWWEEATGSRLSPENYRLLLQMAPPRP